VRSPGFVTQAPQLLGASGLSLSLLQVANLCGFVTGKPFCIIFLQLEIPIGRGMDVDNLILNPSDGLIEVSQSRFRLGQMVISDVTTEVFIEFRESLDPGSTMRNLVAVSDDGRPNRVIPVPNSWSDQELAELVKTTIEPSLVGSR
jgi:hypothetical protein